MESGKADRNAAFTRQEDGVGALLPPEGGVPVRVSNCALSLRALAARIASGRGFWHNGAAGKSRLAFPGLIVKLNSIFLAAGVAWLIATSAGAQSADALVQKLVEKGILTAAEAKELKAEADRDFSTAFAVRSGLPEWVTSFQFHGDFRGRYNVDWSENDAYVTRTRWRYRARFGFLATMRDDLEVGLRLGSGDVDSGVTTGLSPLSLYQTAQNNASKKGRSVILPDLQRSFRRFPYFFSEQFY